jgi:hypothetical protein
MFRNIVRAGAWAVTAATLALTHAARAGDAPVVVVDVKAAASALDAAKVLQMIAKELHSDVVAPGDPRAATARGTISIDIDQEHAQLSVAYVAREQPIERRLPLTGDAEAQRDAVVSIAGNLARDEASELVAELRRPKAKPKPVANLDSRSDTEEARDRAEREAEQETARMQATLEYYASNDRTSRHGTGAALMGVSAGVISAGIYIGTRAHDDLTWIAVGATSVGVTSAALIKFFTTTRLEDLAAYGRQPGARPYLAQEWRHAAYQEHASRKLAVGTMLAAAALPIGVGVASLADTREGNSRYQLGWWLMATGAIEIVTAGYMASTEGPVESALHAYQRSTGQRSLQSVRAFRPNIGFAAAPGNVFGNFSLAF